MAEYRFNVYSGNAPFVFLSFAPEDRPLVEETVRLLDCRGVRFWLSEGVAPGFERDEVIARKILESGYFIAFLSPRYLDSLDETDELNYARDVNKPLTLVYLSEVELPSGVAMRMSRTQNLERWRMRSDEELTERLLSDPGMAKFYGIADPALAEKADRLLKKLEAYYPDRGVFALDGLDPQLAEALPALCAETEFGSADDLLLAYGFKKITAAEARERRGLRYGPGSEPELIRARVESAINRLRALYPSGTISENIAEKNASLARSVTALSVWLGYADAPEFLQAYGLNYLYQASAGRDRIDHEKLFERLRELYADPNVKKPESVLQLRKEQPELSAALKTLQNSAYERFGCTLKEYLLQIGLLGQKPDRESLGKLQARAIEALRARTEAAGGNFEAVSEALRGILLRVNTQGEIYVFRAEDCPERVELPVGIDCVRKGAFAEQTDLRALVLPAGLKRIEAGAFSGCAALESVTFSEGLEEIGADAFSGCAALAAVTLPASLRSVRSGAFSGCAALGAVTLLNPRVSLWPDAFSGCPWTPEAASDADSELFVFETDKKNRAKITGFKGDPETLTIPDVLLGHPVLSVEKGAFAGLTRLKSVRMGDAIASLGSEAFRGCTSLETVHLPESLPKFVSTVFSDCPALREINVPDAMTELKRGKFRDLKLEHVHIGKGLAQLDGDAFYKGEVDPVTGKPVRGKTMREITVDPENTALRADGTMILSFDGKTLFAELGDPEAVEVPEGVEVIAPAAFALSRRLEAVTLPESLREIGERAFTETALRGIDFPASLKSIGDKAFLACRALESAVIREGVERIGEQAFALCPLREIVLPASLQELGDNAFALFSLYQGETPQRIHVPLGSRVFRTDGSALYGIRDGKRTLLKAFDYAFRRAPDAPDGGGTEYTVEAGTEALAPYAFARCNNLSAVTLPESLREIGERAFLDCAALRALPGLRADCAVSPNAYQCSGLESV